MEPDKFIRFDAAPTCDEVLGKCVVVVEQQKEAIEAQQVTIVKQDEVIAAQDQQIQTEQEQRRTFTTVSIVEGVILLLILIL